MTNARSWEEERDELIAAFKTRTWTLKKWTRQAALVAKDGSSIAFYGGQPYDADKFDLVTDAWGHDHCELCFVTISDFVREGDKARVVNEGYTDGDNWVCCECFRRYNAK